MNGQSYTAAKMGHLKIINHLFDCYIYVSQFGHTQNGILLVCPKISRVVL